MRWQMCGLLLFTFAMGASRSTHASTRYHLRVTASPSIPQTLVLGLTCSDSAANQLVMLGTTFDGTMTLASSQGGPIFGGLAFGDNPADTTILGTEAFYSEIGLRLQSGTRFDSRLELTEVAPLAGSPMSELAIYVRDETGIVRVATTDPLGADALAVIDVDGTPGGQLTVFSPLVFVAPDTLLLDGATVGVGGPGGERSRVLLRPVAPNPSNGHLRFAFELPAPGSLKLRIYDVSGRLIVTPVDRNLQRGPGSADWDGRGRSGSRVPPGIYLAVMNFGGETAVRRFVVAR